MTLAEAWGWRKFKLTKDNDFMVSATAAEFLEKTGISEFVSRVDLASSWCHRNPKFRLIFLLNLALLLFFFLPPLTNCWGGGVGLRGNDRGRLA